MDGALEVTALSPRILTRTDSYHHSPLVSPRAAPTRTNSYDSSPIISPRAARFPPANAAAAEGLIVHGTPQPSREASASASDDEIAPTPPQKRTTARGPAPGPAPLAPSILARAPGGAEAATRAPLQLTRDAVATAATAPQAPAVPAPLPATAAPNTFPRPRQGPAALAGRFSRAAAALPPSASASASKFGRAAAQAAPSTSGREPAAPGALALSLARGLFAGGKENAATGVVPAVGLAKQLLAATAEANELSRQRERDKAAKAAAAAAETARAAKALADREQKEIEERELDKKQRRGGGKFGGARSFRGGGGAAAYVPFGEGKDTDKGPERQADEAPAEAPRLPKKPKLAARTKAAPKLRARKAPASKTTRAVPERAEADEAEKAGKGAEAPMEVENEEQPREEREAVGNVVGPREARRSGRARTRVIEVLPEDSDVLSDDLDENVATESEESESDDGSAGAPAAAKRKATAGPKKKRVSGKAAEEGVAPKARAPRKPRTVKPRTKTTEEGEEGAEDDEGAPRPAAKPRARKPASKDRFTVTVDADGHVIVKPTRPGKGQGGASIKLNLKRKGGPGRFKASRNSRGPSKFRRGKFDPVIGEAGLEGIDEDLALEMGQKVAGAAAATAAAVPGARKRKGSCYRCGKEGHWSGDCPLNGAGAKRAKRGFLEDTDDEAPLPVAGNKGVVAAAGDAPPAMLPDGDPDLGVAVDDIVDATHVRVEWPPLPPLPADMLEEENLTAVLQAAFGHGGFRPLQLEALRRVLRGEGTLAILPTGHGKSLIYQMAALLFARAYGADPMREWNPGALSGPGAAILDALCPAPLVGPTQADGALGLATLVVSPLISLMIDQLSKLPPCLAGEMLWKGQPAGESSRILRRLEGGELHVLFVAPERLGSAAFRRALAKCGRVGLLCIDESHCISAWGHSFRPAYLRLASFLEDFGWPHAVLALTATATRPAAAQICKTLALDAARDVIRTPHVLPDRIQVRAIKCEPAAVDTSMFYNELGKQFEEGLLRDHASVLIYVNFQAAADRLASYLAEKHRIQVLSYHAGKKDTERTRVQDMFAEGKLRAVVATVAYGMGLDNSHVTAVVHAGTPRSLEDLVQMAGRAGRSDGAAPVLCLAYPDTEELIRLRSLASMSGVDLTQVRTFLRILFGRDPHPHPLGPKSRTVRKAPAGAPAPSKAESAQRAPPFTLLDLILLEDAVGIKLEVMESMIALLESGSVGGAPFLRSEPTVKGCVDFAFYAAEPAAILAELRADHTAAIESGAVDLETVDGATSFAATWALTGEGRAARVLKSALAVCPRPNSRGSYPVAMQDLCAEAGMAPLDVLRTLNQLARRGARCHVHGNDHVVCRLLRAPEDLLDLSHCLYEHLRQGEERGVVRLDLAYSAMAAAAEPVKAFWARVAAEPRARPMEVRSALDAKAAIAEYFLMDAADSPLLTAARALAPLPLRSPDPIRVAADVRTVADALEGNGARVTDRIVARFFHGLSTPDAAVQTWGKHLVWSRYRDCDFGKLAAMARKELQAWALEKYAAAVGAGGSDSEADEGPAKGTAPRAAGTGAAQQKECAAAADPEDGMEVEDLEGGSGGLEEVGVRPSEFDVDAEIMADVDAVPTSTEPGPEG